MTGSARLLGLRALPDALVGRKETIELWPLSQAELAGRSSGFIDRIFSGDVNPDLTRTTTTGAELRQGYFDRLTIGGFPEATRRADRRRDRFFGSYVDDLVDRDVSQLGDIGRRGHLMRLIGLLAANAGQLFVVDRFASNLAVAAKTVDRYVSLFEEVFLVKRLPAWSSSMTTRAVRTRKLVFVDSGLAANLCGRNSLRLARGDVLGGPLLENFVLSEFARLSPLSEAAPELFHYRTRDGVEVDLVLERRDGGIAAVEVKVAQSVRPDDLRGVTHLRDHVGDAFVAGIVLYTGSDVRSLGDRLWAVPLDALWAA